MNETLMSKLQKNTTNSPSPTIPVTAKRTACLGTRSRRPIRVVLVTGAEMFPSCIMACSLRRTRHRRGAVGVEGVDRLESPGLPLGPFRRAPADRSPVGRLHQSGAGVAELDPV